MTMHQNPPEAVAWLESNGSGLSPAIGMATPNGLLQKFGDFKPDMECICRHGLGCPFAEGTWAGHYASLGPCQQCETDWLASRMEMCEDCLQIIEGRILRQYGEPTA